MGNNNPFGSIRPENFDSQSKLARTLLRYIGFGFLALLAVITVLGTFYSINQRERGVILRNGAFVGIAQPGLGIKIPFIDEVVRLSLESHSRRFEQMNAYSSDQQPADVRMSVNYHLDPSKIESAYLRYKDIETLTSRVIDTHSPQEAKVVTGRFTASTSINDRGPLNDAIKTALSNTVVDEPVIIESVQIEDIKFSPTYEKSVEDRMLAEVEVLKLKQNLDREKVQAEITVTIAKAKADSSAALADGNAKATILNAKADSDAIRLRGDAEASAIKARAAALGDNPQIVALTEAEKWDGRLPTQMIPNSAIPFLTNK